MIGAIALVLGAVPAQASEPAWPVQGGHITAVGPFVPSSTLFITERALPSSPPPRFRRTASPHDLWMLNGETEGFQIAFAPDSTGRVEARLSADSDPWLVDRLRFYRVLDVPVRTPSTGQHSKPGRYPDPIPEQVGAIGSFDKGDLRVVRGRTASVLVVVEDGPAADPGTTFRGTVELVSQTGRLLVRQPFSATVGDEVALQPGDPLAFKVGAGFKPRWYQRGMPPAAPGAQQRRQTTALLEFLSRRFVSINNWEGDEPNPDGTYSAASKAALDAHTELPWGIQFFPSYVGHTSIEYDYATDYPRLAALLRTVGSYWTASGIVSRNPTWLYVYDEPDVREQRGAVAPISSLVHRRIPGVRTFATGNPRRSYPRRRKCGGSPRLCVTMPGNAAGNESLWDGIGSDDLDAWAPLIFRQYGHVTTARQARAGFNRAFDYSSPIRSAQSRGAEMWTYSFYAATDRVPTLAIDSPAVDPKVLTWQHALEGRTGWYIWQFARWSHPVVGRDEYRDPWNQSLSIITRNQHWFANGVASFIYPANRPDLALSGPDHAPIGSLRLEGLRAAVEDYNLLAQYGQKFGEAAMKHQVQPLFGRLRSIGLSTGEVWPAYSTSHLSERMELRRRTMIKRLSSNL